MRYWRFRGQLGDDRLTVDGIKSVGLLRVSMTLTVPNRKLYTFHFSIMFQGSPQECSVILIIHYRSFGKTMPLLGSTEVLLVVRRPIELKMYPQFNHILPYIFCPNYMYDKKEYPQFLSGSGKLVAIISLKIIIQISR